jgi:hypothetical protein
MYMYWLQYIEPTGYITVMSIYNNNGISTFIKIFEGMEAHTRQ